MIDEKRIRDAALLPALHPGIIVPDREEEVEQAGPPRFNGGPRGERPPRHAEPTWEPSLEMGPVWREYEIEDGADLFFGEPGEK